MHLYEWTAGCYCALKAFPAKVRSGFAWDNA
ncbi:Hypothetical protein, conserved [Brucella canis ATCC 23365]|uniref:Uncharacterized protein n=1 Tax=Brucella canis (strain ATCC 23365 / NCTC 10854 / RM-666) TaxID=483179 RepID=A9M5J7_BRUC2|nr:Hypothetical protein, conserved [Brucella canis ATCC 23365]